MTVIVDRRCLCKYVDARKIALCLMVAILDRWDLENIVAELPCRRFWAAGPTEGGIHLIVEQEKDEDKIGMT